MTTESTHVSASMHDKMFQYCTHMITLLNRVTIKLEYSIYSLISSSFVQPYIVVPYTRTLKLLHIQYFVNLLYNMKNYF